MANYSNQLSKLAETLQAAYFLGIDRSGFKQLLQAAQAHANPDLTPYLYPFLWSEDQEIVLETNVTIASLVSNIPIANLGTFDQFFRSRTPFRPPNMELPSALIDSNSYWQSLAVISCHPSGYLRQGAVNLLRAEDTGVAIPFLLLRTVDWVPAVRSLAREAIREKLHPKFAPNLARCLPLVFQLRKNESRIIRRQISTLLDEIEYLGSHPDALSIEEVKKFHAPLRRFHYRLLHDHGSSATFMELLKVVLADPDPSVRVMAPEWMSGKEAEELRIQFADTVLKDKSAVVRLKAFWLIVNAEPEKYQEVIKDGLTDPNLSVQGIARGAWRILLKRDAAAFYRNRLSGEKAGIAVSLRGLRGESNIVDEAVVRPFLHHCSPGVRREALRTLASWSVAGVDQLLIDAVTSRSMSDAKEAMRLLRVRPFIVPEVKIREMLTQPERVDMGIRLLAGVLNWSTLPKLLSCQLLVLNQRVVNQAFNRWYTSFNPFISLPMEADLNNSVDLVEKFPNFPLCQRSEVKLLIAFMKRKILI